MEKEIDPYAEASDKDIDANNLVLQRLKSLNAESQGLASLREHLARLEKEGRGM